ncbi:tRNA pseudouridine(55) synthase TruB [Clostridium sp. W14A]|uniref:tRNA pseudouridine synthase B n=1 Tax=Caproicibacter fermentans TaxID=2576756 RepID=A0A7G8T7H0_9FIRM|nr:tRNA pseudouridine(55) synthase TruB [Caproicibacter fermentans]OCN01218.1 tRNA pseudouridine(55) synthase TruB [Clostridium sp. W14A]QNK39561.1 tRNA pseudouridine(55) synthase TruB [Caproicibacter fermentans]
MNGILILDKPAGFTSFDAVAVMRGLTHEKKIGHTGTLDPMATGVLPLLLGCATRANALLPDTDKEYEAGFRLGIATDTQDTTGKTTAESDRGASREAVEAALGAFRGEILQVPPMVSAISVGGKRLYDLARQGIEVEREPRPVTIRELELLSYDEPSRSGTLRIACSKGTYIRTLCADLGEALHTYGVMSSLRRTRASGFTLADSVTLDRAKELAAGGRLAERLLPVESLFSGMPAVSVSPAQAARFQNGGALDLERTALRRALPAEDAVFRVQGPDGAFLGLGRASAGQLRVLRLFRR